MCRPHWSHISVNPLPVQMYITDVWLRIYIYILSCLNKCYSYIVIILLYISFFATIFKHVVCVIYLSLKVGIFQNLQFHKYYVLLSHFRYVVKRKYFEKEKKKTFFTSLLSLSCIKHLELFGMCYQNIILNFLIDHKIKRINS